LMITDASKGSMHSVYQRRCTQAECCNGYVQPSGQGHSLTKTVRQGRSWQGEIQYHGPHIQTYRAATYNLSTVEGWAHHQGPRPYQSPFGDMAAAVMASWCDVDANQSLTDCVVYAGGIHFQLFRQLGHRPRAMAQAAPDLKAEVIIPHQAFLFRCPLREYSWATTLRPANCAPT